MKSLYNTRKEKGVTQEKLAEMTGILQPNLSAIENGRRNPTEKVRERIEKVLGKIDWLESEQIHVESGTYYKAERLVKKLVEITLTMKTNEKHEINKLICKYFPVEKKLENDIIKDLLPPGNICMDCD